MDHSFNPGPDSHPAYDTRFDERGIPAALACLFLLSTGDDRYVPPVKAYFGSFPKDVKAIGDHTWARFVLDLQSVLPTATWRRAP